MACNCNYSCSGGSSRQITEHRKAMLSEHLRLQSVRFLIIRKEKPETIEKKVIKFL
jgi:hypothetical protein